MPGGPQTFTSPRAVAMLAKIVDFIGANDGVTLAEVTKIACLSECRVGEYLVFAADTLDLIHRLPRPRRIGNRGISALKWVGGPRPKTTKRKVAERQDVEMSQRTVKRYPRNRVPVDPFTAAFFGPARA